MSEQRVQVFSGDPTLAPYLAHYLQAPSCSMLEEEGKFYLGSSYFEKLPLLVTPAQRKRASAGLAAVLDLMSPGFATLTSARKNEACKQAVLGILNGVLKLKYKNCSGLARYRRVTPEVIEPGGDYEVKSSGQRISTTTKDFTVRAVIGAGEQFFRAADRRKPSTKRIWNLARNNAAVARGLYHYARSEDVVELRKVVEEIMVDTDSNAAARTRKIASKEWLHQRWTEPEVTMNKMEEAYALLHNSLMLGDQALHCMPFADIPQATKFQASGATMSLQEARDIVHTILTKWVTIKA